MIKNLAEVLINDWLIARPGRFKTISCHRESGIVDLGATQ
jgi:hypothetical protein